MSGKKFGKHYFQDELTAISDVILDTFKKTVADPTKFLQTDANGKIIEGTPAGGGGFIQLTYAQFATLYDEGTLSPGTWYMITDFATNHMIKEITTSGIVDTGEENLGQVESLLLFAYSEFDYLHEYAFLPDWGERCTYEVFNGSPALDPGTNFKGVITRRHNDHWKVSMPMDWRNVVWKVGSEYWKPVENVTQMYNVYIGNAQYNVAQPLIIRGDRLFNVNIAEQGYYCIFNAVTNVDVYRCAGMNVNIRLDSIRAVDIGSNYYDLVDQGFANGIFMSNTTGNGQQATVGGIDLPSQTKFNEAFLWGGVGGALRGITVNTSTNEISIIV